MVNWKPWNWDIARATGLKGSRTSQVQEQRQGEAAVDYLTSGRMGVDTGAFQIGDQYTSQFDEAARAAQGRQAPQAGSTTVDTTQQEQWRRQEQALANLLAARASGTAGPSAAEIQGQQAMERAISTQRGMAAGATGANRALAGRTAAANIGQIQGEAAGNAALLRAQEQTQAQQALRSLLGQARGADIGLATTQAGMDQQTRMANLQAALQQGATNDQLMVQLMNMGFSRDQAQAQLNAAAEALAAQNYGIATGAGIQGGAGITGAPGLVGSGMAAGAGIIGAGITAAAASSSDERLKKNIKYAGKDIDAFMKAIKPESWVYDRKKNKKKQGSIGVPETLMRGKDGEKRVGVMAQKLMKSEVGKSLVEETETGGLIVKDYESAPVVLASLARIAERLEALEKKKGK